MFIIFDVISSNMRFVMGSSYSQYTDPFLALLSEESTTTLLTAEIQELSYEDFLTLLRELNILSKKCLDSNGNQLVFAVKKGTDTNLFWKTTVQIACVKVDPLSQKVAAFRLLTLNEFLKVFKTFKCQSLAVEHCKSTSPSADMTISGILDTVSKSNTENQTECCICFDRKQDVTLPCAHSYCVPCFEEWNETHDTCPICREVVDSTDETWVMSDVPKAEEICKEIQNSLMELTKEKSPSCSPS